MSKCVCKPIIPTPPTPLTHRIELYSRTITAPSGSSVDYSENFTLISTEWAGIKTKTTLEVFDSTNTITPVSHVITINYRSDVTAETWVKLKGKYFDIISMDNIDEEDAFLRMNCVERGSVNKPVNFS